MSLVDVIVEVPCYSYKLTVAVPPSSNIRDVKHEIERRCPGGPRPDKQRLIALGRELADGEHIESVWKTAPRTVHLAVGHGGWASAPPGPAPAQQSQSITMPQLLSQPNSMPMSQLLPQSNSQPPPQRNDPMTPTPTSASAAATAEAPSPAQPRAPTRTTALAAAPPPTYRFPENEADYVPGRSYMSMTPPTPGLAPGASAGVPPSHASSPLNPPSASSGLTMPRRVGTLHHMHQKALNALCPDVPVPPLHDDPVVCRNAAISMLKEFGNLWPAILDEDFPPETPSHVKYEQVTVSGKRYLQLTEDSVGQTLTPRQEHALKVLSTTFSLLDPSVPASNPPPPPTPTTTATTIRTRQQPRAAPIPPHVNQLLQQLGLPPMRVAAIHNAAANGNVAHFNLNLNNANGNVNGNANQNQNQNNQNAGALMRELRQIPLRPLLAPVVMLVLRTLLLLYFVAPARKPIFGVLILGWMLYEIWQPIRNGLRNGWGRGGQNGAQQQQIQQQLQQHLQQHMQQIQQQQQQQQQQQGQQGQQEQGQQDGARQGGLNAGAGRAPDANVNANANGGQQGGGNGGMAAHARVPQGAPGLEQQAGALFDTLANMNIEDEQRMLEQGGAAAASPPSFGHKLVTFVGLFVATLHPAIWNRRRVALRRREGAVRTVAHVRNSAPPASQSQEGGADAAAEPTAAEKEAMRRREEMRAQYERRPRWIQQYEERVLAEDWVDDSD